MKDFLIWWHPTSERLCKQKRWREKNITGVCLSSPWTTTLNLNDSRSSTRLKQLQQWIQIEHPVSMKAWPSTNAKKPNRANNMKPHRNSKALTSRATQRNSPKSTSPAIHSRSNSNNSKFSRHPDENQRWRASGLENGQMSSSIKQPASPFEAWTPFSTRNRKNAAA